ncbi:MAG: phenylalanine--tRNA ligase subunit beta [Alphaproteobacteria bacterium]|nr:phenylalanine--tRNA ligase subunit beta [Alphaproteobacteria bacterium]
MKFTLSWLKDHLDTKASLDEIVETLTKIGLEVEHVDDPAKKLAGFTIAHVIEAKQHPNADRLRVCMVDTGAGAPVQVVCGAPNARTGMKSVFAPAGTYIPGKDITLGKGVIRGVESNGMLCSGMELQVSEDHEGILDLPADAPLGARYVDYAKLSDPVIEINLTPNRPDATGVHGIARDLAAAGLGVLKDHAIKPAGGAFPCPVAVKLDLSADDAHLAPAFALRLVRGVKNGPSPEWMQKRLKAIGLRPINALVDITNYVTFDRGRPLHVFDARKVKGNLVVRRAKQGEEVLALDGKTYALTPENVVICDDSGVESIAGVMGGEHSGCDENTTDVLIESALWDAMNIARTGRSLGIVTDARYRFERGVDPAFCTPGAELATHLVIQLCGGEPSQLVATGKLPEADKQISFPLNEVERLTGHNVPRAEKISILEKLGFAVSGAGETVNVKVPSWRPDVEGKADLAEEIIRIHGVDNVMPQPLPRAVAEVAKPILTLLQKRTSQARRALAAQGLVEAVTWSFVSKDRALAFGGGKPQLALANPIAADLSDMRPSLLPGLLDAAQRNGDRGFGDVALFEVGQIFLGETDRDQRMAASAVRRGAAKISGAGRHWSQRAADVDVYDAKADAMALLAALGVQIAGLQIVAGGPSWFHPGRSGTMQFGPKGIIGHFGEIHPRVLQQLEIEGPLCAFEIILDALPAPKAKPTKAKAKLELSGFMPVERDFAFIADAGVNAADIVRAAQTAGKQMVAGVNVFDVYHGTGIPEGKKSVAISVTLQPREKTLTDEEIDAIAAQITGEVAKKTGAVLRG